MTLRNARPLPCWQVTDLRTGEHPYAESADDYWAHHQVEAEALTEADEMLREWLADNDDRPVIEVPKLVAAVAYARPCAELVCDGCVVVWEDSEYGGTHLDPSDPEPVRILDSEWVTTLVGNHYCTECPVPDGTVKAARPVPVSPDQAAIPFGGVL